ncbi:LysR substrate-binding domain-containing protein [Amycolatopsis rhabdoformis]|uniref:LysR substrate-binding domain-containing protein n=1 Tax=Amycolatopsis rhabdoformis TaxID=1448059 RepID=A0ABZ1IG14_9PSEU|nr:LysR substrate-binding domain-containing protein [Amycolatopsis rhabdoformis]WSE32494.1 LysR substrate-binding domain-containing protein [Amycolatopsis rhabdoformis]
MDPARLPSFSLRQLLYFVTAAESGTIRAAAARLHVAESAVSVALTELERAVDAQLVVRRRAHGVTLTPSGRTTLRLAKALLHQARELEEETAGEGAALTGPLAIGCYPMLGPSSLPRLLSGFAGLHPGVTVDFHEDTQDRLHRRLADGELDLAIMYDLDLPESLPRTELDRRVPHVLLPPDHALARGPLDLRDLEPEPMVLLDAPPSTNHALAVCAQAGIRPSIRYRTVNFETARALVGRGLGWTLLVTLPSSPVTYEGLEVVTLYPDYPVLDPVRVVLTWPDDARLSRRAREFLRFAAGHTSENPRSLP